MPSLAAVAVKSEVKISSPDPTDPVKLIQQMIEKKIRNLEKRKLKLDNYRQDVANGKELNEDQKIAVSKYDEVEYALVNTRELFKTAQSIITESARAQKKQAKKEQIERQQHEIQRLQEGFVFRHMLSCLQNEDVQADFLNGENGAVKLTSEQLSQLDQFYKLIGPGLPAEQADISNYFHALAENYIFLVEGKNKEIVGTTYKVLKDVLQSIKDCGYFSRPSEPLEEDGTSSEDTPEDDSPVDNGESQETADGPSESVEEPEPQEQIIQNGPENIDMAALSITNDEVPLIENEGSQFQNGPLQEVLSSQSAFNFLQESQIDLDAPHMDPAVVAVHQMAPPTPASVNFAGNMYTAPQQVEEKPLISAPENCDVSSQVPQVNQVPVMPAAIPRTVAPVLSSVQLSQQEFDPSHPIPTQTFTNQSFAVMQNMILPQAYVPVTMHHGPMSHIAPVAVVPGLSNPVTSGGAAAPMPMPVPVAPVCISPTADNVESETDVKNEAEDTVKQDENSPEVESIPNNNEKNMENGYNNYRGGYRRGRARGNNGYYRGRSSYNGRGGYQNHYYQDRNGYNGNYRRGNNRGPRGGNGNNRGRGNYRTQGSSHQQHQHHHHQQQHQQQQQQQQQQQPQTQQ